MKKRYIKINDLHKLCTEMGLLSLENKCMIVVDLNEYILYWVDTTSTPQRWQLTIAKEIFFDPFDKIDICLIKLSRYEYDISTSTTGGLLNTRHWLIPIELMKTPKVLAETLNRMTVDLNYTPTYDTARQTYTITNGPFNPNKGIATRYSTVIGTSPISHSIQP